MQYLRLTPCIYNNKYRISSSSSLLFNVLYFLAKKKRVSLWLLYFSINFLACNLYSHFLSYDTCSQILNLGHSQIYSIPIKIGKFFNDGTLLILLEIKMYMNVSRINFFKHIDCPYIIFHGVLIVLKLKIYWQIICHSETNELL